MEASRFLDGMTARRCSLTYRISLDSSHLHKLRAYSLPIGIVHESVTLLDELLGEDLNLFKVVRSMNDFIEANLNHGQILLNTLLKQFLLVSKTNGPWAEPTYILLERVGVVKSKDELSLVLVGQESVQDSSLQMSDM
jgi:hypothetical protein